MRFIPFSSQYRVLAGPFTTPKESVAILALRLKLPSHALMWDAHLEIGFSITLVTEPLVETDSQIACVQVDELITLLEQVLFEKADKLPTYSTFLVFFHHGHLTQPA